LTLERGDEGFLLQTSDPLGVRMREAEDATGGLVRFEAGGEVRPNLDRIAQKKKAVLTVVIAVYKKVTPYLFVLALGLLGWRAYQERRRGRFSWYAFVASVLLIGVLTRLVALTFIELTWWPGFEFRFQSPSLPLVYGVVGLGLTALPWQERKASRAPSEDS
jgi:hypothetical protein